MSFKTKLDESDGKFVEAALDAGKRQAQIERLRHSRRTLNIVVIIQAVCFVISTIADIVAHYVEGSKLGTSPSPSLMGGIILFCAIGLYTDLQIKFLKTYAATQVGQTAEKK